MAIYSQGWKSARKALLLFLLLPLCMSAQTPGTWGIQAGASALLPAGDLSAWFGKGFSGEIAAGTWHNASWYIEGIADYSRFRDHHPVTDAADNIRQQVPLSLWYGCITVQGKYMLTRRPLFRSYVSIGAGPCYWEGIRGEIREDAELAIPHIPEKVLREWNMGFRAGTGAELLAGERLVLDAGLAYRLVVGALWPTMQEHVELEAVNGFQSIAFYLRVKMYFR